MPDENEIEVYQVASNKLKIPNGSDVDEADKQ